jgi:hypothetical protein
LPRTSVKDNEVTQAIEEKNKAFVLETFETLFNKRDYAAAERFWSPNYIQHSAHIAPAREGLFELVITLPEELRYDNALIVADSPAWATTSCTTFRSTIGQISGLCQTPFTAWTSWLMAASRSPSLTPSIIGNGAGDFNDRHLRDFSHTIYRCGRHTLCVWALWTRNRRSFDSISKFQGLTFSSSDLASD